MHHPADKFSGRLFLRNQVSNQLQFSPLLIMFFCYIYYLMAKARLNSLICYICSYFVYKRLAYSIYNIGLGICLLKNGVKV